MDIILDSMIATVSLSVAVICIIGMVLMIIVIELEN